MSSLCVICVKIDQRSNTLKILGNTQNDLKETVFEN